MAGGSSLVLSGIAIWGVLTGWAGLLPMTIALAFWLAVYIFLWVVWRKTEPVRTGSAPPEAPGRGMSMSRREKLRRRKIRRE